MKWAKNDDFEDFNYVAAAIKIFNLLRTIVTTKFRQRIHAAKSASEMTIYIYGAKGR